MTSGPNTAADASRSKEQVPMTGGQKLGMATALALFLFIWFTPLPQLDELTRHTLALLAATIVLWISKPWMPALTGMLFAVLAWLLGLADQRTAFSGLSSTTAWFVWAALVLARATRETELDVRLSQALMRVIPLTTRGVMGMQFSMGWLLSYLIPSSTGRVAALAPLAASQVRSLGLPVRSQAGRMLMIGIVIVNWAAAQSLVTGGSTPLLAWGIMNENGFAVTWVQWWAYLIFPLAVTVLLFTIGCWFLFRPEKERLETSVSTGDGDAVETSAVLKASAPLTSRQRRLMLTMLAILLLWVTESFHGISTALVGILGGIWVLLPRVGVLNAEDSFRKIGWHTVIFVAIAISLGAVLEQTGVASLLSSVLQFVLSVGDQELLFLLLLAPVGLFGRVLLRGGAATVAVLLVPTMETAQSLGFNTTLVGVLFPISLGGLFIYQHVFGLIAYDYGAFEEVHFIAASAVRFGCTALAIVLSYYFWWPLFF